MWFKMVKKSCENCKSKAYFENKDSSISYFCVIKGEFIKDLNDLCECWIKSKNIIRKIVNKECDRLERINEIITII